MNEKLHQVITQALAQGKLTPDDIPTDIKWKAKMHEVWNSRTQTPRTSECFLTVASMFVDVGRKFAEVEMSRKGKDFLFDSEHDVRIIIGAALCEVYLATALMHDMDLDLNINNAADLLLEARDLIMRESADAEESNPPSTGH